MSDELENQEISEPETVAEPVSEEEENRRPLFDTPVSKKDLDAIFGRLSRIEKDLKQSSNPPREVPQPVAANASTGDDGLDRILEVKTATDGLEAREVQMLRLISKQKRVPLLQARDDDDFKTWQNGYKTKVVQENVNNNTPLPTTQQPSVSGPKSLKDMTRDERDEYFKRIGLKKAYRPPQVIE